MLGFASKSCPPLLEVPPHVLEQAATTPVALESYLRLHPVRPGEGLIGEVWEKQEPLLISSHDQAARLSKLKDTALQTESAMICPLAYAGQCLGVLAVANGPMGSPFSASDFEVFKAISEQSAFALYNAIIYSEAGEKTRLDLDLQTARDIQRILLPESAPAVAGYEISGTTIPARHVSGDYYDYIKVDEDRLGIVIADVSGKGVPASLIMAMCRSVLRSHAVGNASAADVLRKVNRQLYPDIREDMFISMAYVILNHRTKQITLSRAGHDAPFFYSNADQSVTRLNPPGMAIGIDSGDVFDRVTGDFSVNLEGQDCLILYTDGMTEAVDRNGLEFGVARTIQAIQSSVPNGAADVIRYLTEDLRNFIGKEPQYDDVTLIAIKRI
jgi:sigma-B regulation protein RsbU (phosphoserine phosphatase)